MIAQFIGRAPWCFLILLKDLTLLNALLEKNSSAKSDKIFGKKRIFFTEENSFR